MGRKFAAEYAKSNRASCKGCRSLISKDFLRLAIFEPSPFHDGFITSWYHPHCFFREAKPTSTSDISNFDNLRWKDQETIRSNIGGDRASTSGCYVGLSKFGGGKKRPYDMYKDFKVENAKSNGSTCTACEEPILKDAIQVSKMDYESEKTLLTGGIERWHHLDCFAQVRGEMEFFDSGDVIPGYRDLSKKDKAKVKAALPKIENSDGPDVKKAKKEESEASNKVQKLLQQQNEEMFEFRDELVKVPKKNLKKLLLFNDQHVSYSPNNMMDHLADLMTFGAIETCEKCKNGQFKYLSGVGYTCRGNLTEWTKCDQILATPKRRFFLIPEDLKKKYQFLKDYVPRTADRLFKLSQDQRYQLEKTETNETNETNEPLKIVKRPLPLKGMEFVIAGRLNKTKEQLKDEIIFLGGTVSSYVSRLTAAVISTEKALKKGASAIAGAQQLDIQVVSEDFIEEAKDYKTLAIDLIDKKRISSWGSDPVPRINDKIASSAFPNRGNSKYRKSSYGRRGRSMYDRPSSGVIKLKMKGGGAVDPDSGLESKAHVYKSNGNKYTVTLGLTDLQSGRNSYYKMQILEHDNTEKYWLFRSWGRIGTLMGQKKLDTLPLETCIQKFEDTYADKTGNLWENRNDFVKKPNLMYPLDVNECDDEDQMGKFNSDIKSNLKKPIQDLIKLIFDIDRMRKVMTEYEIDTDRMPLGKLSKQQLQSAYSVLTQALQIIKSEPNELTELSIIDLSNRFYTLVPHSFGFANPPLLNNESYINLKCQMLDSLMEIEIAYNLLHNNHDKNINPVDSYYKKLNADMDVLDKESEEFKLIETYAKNTHAATHRSYELEIEDVFTLKRHGEDRRFQPFKNLHNRKLLWHGSRTTNYGGIISKGLRIAPSEAPSTGYMFGKGIYFADMVSKSANYCCTSSQNPTGLLLLCEVALGNMYERFDSAYIEKLPKGKHSTFGIGQTCPHPDIKHVTQDGVEIPLGPAFKPTLPNRSDLLYNEYIVYNPAQVQIQYLVRMKFNHKL